MSEKKNWSLQCGDSLAWLRSLPNESADAIITDPPYASTGDAASVMRRGDSPALAVPKETQFFEAWFREYLAEWKRVLKRTGFAWFTIDWRGSVAVEDACCRLGIRPGFTGVWDRGGMGMGWAVRRTYECWSLLCMDDWAPRRNDIPDLWHVPWNSAHRKTGHAAEKPVELFRKALQSFGTTKSLVVDPFAGSGTSGVAALLEGCSFAGCERDDRFVEIAKERISGTAGEYSSKGPQPSLFGGHRE